MCDVHIENKFSRSGQSEWINSGQDLCDFFELNESSAVINNNRSKIGVAHTVNINPFIPDGILSSSK